MGKVIYGINLSADGCCDHTKFNGGEETHEYFANLMHNVDLIVYGRKTYELMVPYWPEVAKNPTGIAATDDFARTFSAIDKVVFSQTLKTADGNTAIIGGNLQQEFLKLKEQPGKTISLGGVDLPSQLIALGLVDEFYFMVHPVIVGEGRRLFAHTEMQKLLNLQLVSTKTFKSGAIALHYKKLG